MTKDWVDFKAVKQDVSMQMVLDHYGINWLRKNRDELRGRCPIHKGEGGRTFHVNLSKNAFNCFSCRARGNVLDLVAAMEPCTVRDAALKLQTWFGAAESELSQPPESEKHASHEPSGPINPTLPFQLRVEHSHEYGLSRGVSKETLEYFGAGLCLSKGTFSSRFVIPMHNVEGQLVGYAGRSIDDSEPRYLFPSAEKGFHKRYLLWNLHRVLEIAAGFPAQKVRRRVIVVEGFFDAMKLRQAGFPSVLSLLGSSMSIEQEALLFQYFDGVLLLFDGDEAGRGATDECLLRLGRRIWVKAISLPDAVQPDQLSIEEIQTMLVSL